MKNSHVEQQKKNKTPDCDILSNLFFRRLPSTPRQVFEGQGAVPLFFPRVFRLPISYLSDWITGILKFSSYDFFTGITRARLVVFPIKGRNWCFTRSLDSVSGPESSSPPPALKDLWGKISSHGRPAQEKAEIVVDFVADKMNRACIGLEKAPAGTFKSKIHSLGLRLLSRVKPSEIFLKSVTKDITKVEITYPSSLNPRLVRRRVRHIATRGAAIHKRYFYGSVSLLPFTTVLAVLPLPNIPFFWILFRAYSHWRALKGSERLLLLVSDCSRSWSLLSGSGKENGSMEDSNCSPDNGDSNHSPDSAPESPWVLKPSDDLTRLVQRDTEDGGVSCCTISSISKEYDLNKKDVLKFKDSQELV